jgi:NMD protein affecting ribosome stability and mRNA decay
MSKCIKCGQSGEFRLFCGQCFLKDHPILREIPKVDIEICPSCNKILSKNKWTTYTNVKEALPTFILQRLKPSDEYAIKGTKVIPQLPSFVQKPGVLVEATALLQLEAYSEENRSTVRQDISLPVHIKFQPCPKCSKEGTQYFEGVLQIRNADEPIRKKIEDVIAMERTKGVYINKVAELKNGIDYFITDVHYIKKFAKVLQNRFGGEMKLAPELHSRNRLESRDLFRLNVLLRLYDIHVGDYVSYKGKVAKVIEAGKTFMGRDLIEKKNLIIDPAKEKPVILKVEKTNVSKAYPQLEVLHPETYQNVVVANPKKLKPGQKVDVIISENKAYLLR